jgi:nucleotide-binding universal stress UspA family protein
MPQLEIILFATDGSPASEPASEQAIDLATQVQARLLVVSVLATSSRPSEASAGPATADSRDSLTTKAQAGDAIVAAADAENADLIVVGSHGRSGVSRFLIGSVSDYVVRHAHCPVMVIRGKPEAVRR